MKFRFLLLLLLASSMPFAAQAKVASSKFVETNLADLTKFTSHYNIFDLNDTVTFGEYLKLTDCTIADSVKNSPFKQQEVQQSVLKSLSTQQKIDKPLYFHIPVVFQVSGYNFDTQSLPIDADTQFKRVNMLELIPPKIPLCERGNTGNITKIPTYYLAKLDTPISIYRIPMQKNLAESVFNKLPVYSESSNIRFVYAYIMLKIETIVPEIQKVSGSSKAIVRGEVMSVNLYTDQDRKIPFKTLEYSDNF